MSSDFLYSKDSCGRLEPAWCLHNLKLLKSGFLKLSSPARLRCCRVWKFTTADRFIVAAPSVRRALHTLMTLAWSGMKDPSSEDTAQRRTKIDARSIDGALSGTSKPTSASGQTVLYFAYGSNMCPRVMGPKAGLLYWPRRISESSWSTGEPAVLEGFALEFSCPGVRALGEPSFANITQAPAAGSETNGQADRHAVHGVVFHLTAAELDRILLSEGVGMNGQRMLNVTVRTYTNKIYENVKTVAYVSPGTRARDRPSSRYLSLVMEGAQYYGLDRRYCRELLRKASGADPSASSRANGAADSDFIGMMRDMEVSPQIVEFYRQMHHLDGAVRFICPPSCDEHAHVQKPLLLFFPGLDGTGISIAPLLRAFQSKYDVRVLVIPRDNRLKLQELASSVLDAIETLYCEKASEMVQEGVASAGPVLANVLAESMGCLLWFECVRVFHQRVASKPETSASKSLLDRKLARHAILVNAATSFADSSLAPLWENLSIFPDGIYNIAPYIFSPMLIDLLQLLNDPTSAYQSLRRMGVLREILPKQTLRHRVLMIRDFSYSAHDYRVAAQIGAERYTIVASANDGLLPSLAESERLMKQLSRPFSERQRSEKLVPGSVVPATVVRYVARSGGHALLQSRDFDAYQVLIEQAEQAHDRLCSRMVESSLQRGSNSDESNLKIVQGRSASADLKDGVSGVAVAEGDSTVAETPKESSQLNRSFLSVLPEKPEERRALGPRYVPTNRFALGEIQHRIRQQRRLLSPIFLNFDQVPLSTQTPPVLFVGNHTRLGLIDLPFFIDHIWKTRGVFVRGLAHPIIFGSRGLAERPNDRQSQRNGTRAETFVANLKTLGAVPVSPRTVYDLLQRGDSLLLFPGGAREAYKRRGENNQLFWPHHEEFVRLCARLGATIVPFASYGPDDSFDVVLDGKEMLSLPLLGSFIRNQFEHIGIRSDIVRAWRSPMPRTPTDEAIADLLLPLLRPRPPLRLYFQFFDPIYPDANLVRDRKKAQEIYEGIRDTVARGLLCLKRMALLNDPYVQFPRRFGYEELHRGAQAPTLTPWSCTDSHLLL
ncbi:hypothetical protein CCYA_CCYA19G4702 [Cyanidiococcus yangmingshanensis]|nr:hypothetical protein CCYA_CCYA19G4702 [Cyanidiococcus yangmingshanensis]